MFGIYLALYPSTYFLSTHTLFYLWHEKPYLCGVLIYLCNSYITEQFMKIWCDFDLASSLICGNKMPARCNRGFYCRSYCLLSMFRAPLCPSSGAQEYYTVVAACGISCCGFQVAGLVWSWGLCVRFAGCCSCSNLKTTVRNTIGSNHCSNTLELLMMGIVVPETCWASNNICNKNSVASSWHFISTYLKISLKIKKYSWWHWV